MPLQPSVIGGRGPQPAPASTSTSPASSAAALAPRLLQEHPAAAAAHVERWLGGKAEFLKA